MAKEFTHLTGYAYIIIVVVAFTAYIIIPNAYAKVFFALLALATLIYLVVLGMGKIMENAFNSDSFNKIVNKIKGDTNVRQEERTNNPQRRPTEQNQKPLRRGRGRPPKKPITTPLPN